MKEKIIKWIFKDYLLIDKETLATYREIQASYQKLIDQYWVAISRMNSMDGEEFIDKVVDRIKRKQLK